MVFLTLAIDKVVESGDKFLHILTSVQSIIVATGKNLGCKSSLFYYLSTESISVNLLSLVDIYLHHIVKRYDTTCCCGTYLRSKSGWAGNYRPQALVVAACCSYKFVYRRSSDSSFWIIDNALQSLLVVRIGYESEISYYVLYLLALVETHSAINAIRRSLPAQFVLKDTALGIGAIQNGKSSIRHMLTIVQSANLVCHDSSLFLITIGNIKRNLVALRILAEYGLFYLPAIMAD